MHEHGVVERFEAERGRLRAVAYRLLGSEAEAEDAVQEAWLRLSRTDANEVENLSGWLTTVVSRVCLDMLRSRRSRREDALEADSEAIPDSTDPAAEAMLAESVGMAMLTVLQRLSPAERVAFVLHDVFAVPFEEIAAIVGRTPVAARQLASRGRRRVRGITEEDGVVELERQREVVEAFFRASREGDLKALLEVLDPEVVLRADETALGMGAKSGWLTGEITGAEAVAGQFAGRAQAARLALIEGVPGAVWAPGGTPRVAFLFRMRGDRVIGIELVADPERLGRVHVEILA